jgi:hypothetical protein
MAKTMCKGKTATGAPCRAPAGESGLCFFHANPEKAKTLGRRGGQNNRRFVPIDLEVPDNMTLTDLCNLNAQAMRMLLSGELQPRAAAAFAQLSNSQQRVIGADVEARLAVLETKLAREQADEIGQQDEGAGHGGEGAAETIADADDEIAIESVGTGNTDPARREYLDASDANRFTSAGEKEERGPE